MPCKIHNLFLVLLKNYLVIKKQTKVMKFIQLVLYICCVGLIAVSCGSEQTENQENTVTNDTIQTQKSSGKIHKEVKYKLPSPIELFTYLKQNDIAFNADLLHNTQLSGNYNASSELALNLGVYASDLAYCTTFEKSDDADNLFIVLKQLAENLHIPDGYNKDIIKKLDKHASDPDSLYKITDNSYWEVCLFLENNNRHDILAQILLGAWLESNYITLKSIDEFDPENPIISKIVEQNYLLENLIDYLNTLEKNKETTMLYNKLLDLHYSYADLIDNPDTVIMTEEQFDAISSKVIAFRTYIIN